MKKIQCEKGRVGALIVSCRDRVNNYGPDGVDVEVSIGSVFPDGGGVRNVTGWDNAHFESLRMEWTFRADAAEDFNPRFYEVHYWLPSRVDFASASRMAATLKHLNAGFVKIQRNDGDFQTFGAALTAFANLVGAKRIVLQKLGSKVHDYSMDRANLDTYSLADGASFFDLQLATLKQRAVERKAEKCGD